MEKRLDITVSRLAGISRAIAKELITEGKVCVNGKTTAKPGALVSANDRIEYNLPETSYVSRGGHKLRSALNTFGITLDGRVCLDVGASTGGFTDCMLQHGAALVYALDVGTAQLHPTLKAHVRVRSIENTNILAVAPNAFAPPPTFAAVDVSFVSATKLLPHIVGITNIQQIVVLVKPQFECGRAQLSKHGIVHSEKAHKQAIANVTAAAESNGLHAVGFCESPIKGGDGNTEYLALYLKS